MTNTQLLRQRIKESGLKLQYIADYLGISRVTLTRKIENQSDFRQNEIRKLCELLHIESAAEKSLIFFFRIKVECHSSFQRRVRPWKTST